MIDLQSKMRDIRDAIQSMPVSKGLMTTGAIIGSVALTGAPIDMISVTSGAIAAFATEYPYLDVEWISSELMLGAKAEAASIIEQLRQAFERANLQVGGFASDSFEAAQQTLAAVYSRTGEGLRQIANTSNGFLMETKDFLSDMAGKGVAFIIENWETIAAIFAVAKGAYDYYDTADSIYKRWTEHRRSKLAAHHGVNSPDEANTVIASAISAAQATDLNGPHARAMADTRREFEEIAMAADELTAGPDDTHCVKAMIRSELSRSLQDSLSATLTIQNDQVQLVANNHPVPFISSMDDAYLFTKSLSRQISLPTSCSVDCDHVGPHHQTSFDARLRRHLQSRKSQVHEMNNGPGF